MLTPTIVVMAQSISSLLSYLFVTVVHDAIPHDTERATYTGRVYARINIGTMVCQWLILPVLVARLSRSAVAWVWLGLPTALLLPVVQWVSSSTSSVGIVTLVFGLLKVLEYSVRGTMAELVRSCLLPFVLLFILPHSVHSQVYGTTPDDASRFLGKEIIGVVANRLGKSGTAGLLALTAPTPTEAPSLLLGLLLVWWMLSYQLVQQHQQQVKVVSGGGE